MNLFENIDKTHNDYLEEAEFIRGFFQTFPPSGKDYGQHLFSDETFSIATSNGGLNRRYQRQVQDINAKFTHKMPFSKEDLMEYPYFFR